MSGVTPDEEQLKKELESLREQLDKEREDHKRALEEAVNHHEGVLEREKDSYRNAIQHFKLRLMTRAYESMQDVLKMESAINDAKSLFGNKDDV